MSDDIQVILPAGMVGPSEEDSALDKFLRMVGVKYASESEWAEKYGASFENDVFLMHPYCWCDSETCAWCIHGDHPDFEKVLGEKFGNEDQTQPYLYARHRKRHYWDAPLFWYKPLDFRVSWYKFIGRETATNRDLTQAEFGQMWRDCLGDDDWPAEIG